MISSCDEHDDCVVVYQGKECPVCNIVKDRDYFDEQVGELENKVTDLGNEIERIKNE
jgi:hypothetical protein